MTSAEFKTYRDKAFNLIRNLCEDSKDFQDFIKNPCRANSEDIYQRTIFNCDIEGGATRLVIVPLDYDFVIKIPFSTADGIDFCLAEAAYYLEAIDNGVEEFFAWCFFAGIFSDYGARVPLYLMEKADCDEERTVEEAFDYASDNYGYEYSSDAWEVADEKILEFLDYSWNTPKCIMNFLYNVGIDDIHCGNVGIIRGEYVITDYAGFGRTKRCYQNKAEEFFHKVTECFERLMKGE